jgi:hypothetical protein
MQEIKAGDQSVFLLDLLLAGLCSNTRVRFNPTSSQVISTRLLFCRFLFIDHLLLC